MAARLLQEQGATRSTGIGWTSAWAAGEDAQQVAETFGIPFSAGDIRRELEASVMGPFSAGLPGRAHPAALRPLQPLR